MGILRRVVKISRVQVSKTIAGPVYVPRIAVGGTEVRDLGWEYGDRVEVLFDMENETVTIKRIKS